MRRVCDKNWSGNKNNISNGIGDASESNSICDDNTRRYNNICNYNNGVKYEHNARLFALFLMILLALAGCGQSDQHRNEEYGTIIAGLGDDEQFALENIGEKHDVLFMTDMTYDDGTGHNAALYCNIYYIIDGEVCDLGRIESMGTAYPISYGRKCIYTASAHDLKVYEIDTETKRLLLKEQYEAVYDETDQISYRCIADGKDESISEEDYEMICEEYEKSTPVSFGYGAA